MHVDPPDHSIAATSASQAGSAVGIDDGQMEPEARLRLPYFLGGRVASPE
jgi:hypothetical protein